MFKLKEHNTSLFIEISAGVTTFCAMVYVLAVNPSMLSEAGVSKEVIFTATAVAAILGTLAMAFIANLPFAIAPGMGINAFFTYVVILGMGYSWPQAVSAVLIAGVLFVILSLTPLRQKLLREIPQSLKYAVCGGVGMMIAGIGLMQSGLIVFSPSSMPAIGDIARHEVQLVLIGLFITAALLALKFRYALLTGIILSTLIGIPLGVTQTASLLNNPLFHLPASFSSIAFHFDFSRLFSIDFLSVVVTFLFIAIIDSLAGFLGLFSVMGEQDAKRYGHQKMGRAFVADSVAVVFSSLVGVSPNTAYAESGTGVAVGGRTGLTALVTALCFALTLFCAPVFLAIPFAAIAPALMVVGWYMMACVVNINFSDASESFPAMIAIVVIGLSWKISEGLALAWLAYIVMKLVSRQFKDLNGTVCAFGAIFLLKFIA